MALPFCWDPEFTGAVDRPEHALDIFGIARERTPLRRPQGRERARITPVFVCFGSFAAAASDHELRSPLRGALHEAEVADGEITEREKGEDEDLVRVPNFSITRRLGHADGDGAHAHGQTEHDEAIGLQRCRVGREMELLVPPPDG